MELEAGGSRPWLVHGTSRFAGIGRARGRLALGGAVLLVVAALLLPHGAGEPDATAAILEAAAAGQDFYAAATDMLRNDGSDATEWMVPLPTLSILSAILPAWGAVALLLASSAAVFAAWCRLLDPLLTGRIPRVLLGVLLGAGLVGLFAPAGAGGPESWAGLLIAAAVAAQASGRGTEAACAGLAAAAFSPAALPFAATSATLAGMRGNQASAARWGIVLGLGSLVIALHLAALDRVAPGTGAWISPRSFGADGGPLPYATRAALAVAAWGWLSRREAFATHLAAAILVYAALGAVLPLPVGALLAPLLPVGLLFVPDAARDAWRSAATRSRRITVTRLTR